MTKRGAALWGLGFWAMGTVAIALVATRNFAVVDVLLDALPNATFASIVETLGHEGARQFLRYLSSEVNRTLFEAWGWVQLPVGAAVLGFSWNAGPPRVRYAVMIMLGLVLILTFGLTPPIVDVGRSLDFVPRDPAPPELGTFGLLHAGYSILEFAKLGLNLLVSAWLLRSPD